MREPVRLDYARPPPPDEPLLPLEPPPDGLLHVWGMSPGRFVLFVVLLVVGILTIQAWSGWQKY